MKLAVDTNMFKLAVDSVKKQRSSDDMHPIMQGVFFRMTGDDELCLEAVDGYRIANATLAVAREEEGDFTDGVYDLPKTLRLDTKTQTTLEFTREQLIIENGGITLACKCVDGDPFDSSKIFPDEADIEHEYLFDPKYLAEALSTMKNTRRTSHSVRLKFQKSETAPLVLEFDNNGVKQKHLLMPMRK